MNAVFVEACGAVSDVARSRCRGRGDLRRALIGDLLDAAAQPFQRPPTIFPSASIERHSVEAGELEICLLHQHRRTGHGLLAAVASIFGENGVSIQFNGAVGLRGTRPRSRSSPIWR